MNKPAKQIIPYAELLEKVQNLLVCYPQCRNIHIDALDVYREQVDGANWHVTRYRRSGDDHDWPSCWEAIVADIRHLRTCYDADEESS